MLTMFHCRPPKTMNIAHSTSCFIQIEQPTHTVITTVYTPSNFAPGGGAIRARKYKNKLSTSEKKISSSYSIYIYTNLLKLPKTSR